MKGAGDEKRNKQLKVEETLKIEGTSGKLDS